ncbi:Protein STB6 [Nakaseomyces bracarensis]|uniref:Protein STB6 n=1 Tax=Nakaseomyces bracarensis TaxID=273131 RepID=A0ABR4NUH2_9SACH
MGTESGVVTPKLKTHESYQNINNGLVHDELVSFIFPDCRALYKLNLKNYKDLNYSEVQLEGFDIYIVEQWAAVRKLSTLITTYTGNSQDSVFAVRVLLPRATELWPPKFKEYHDKILKFSAPMVIDMGIVFVTELSSIASNLNILHVESGDQREAWKNFKVNYDLKKLKCGGRSALLLRGPSSTAVTKFSQLFKISIDNFPKDADGNVLSKGDSSKNNDDYEMEHSHEKRSHGLHLRPTKSHSEPVIYCPVIELITLIQISLHYFDLFENTAYKDGLLCEDTVRAIDLWWDRYGKIYLGVERPKNEAVIGPTTVAALFSFVLCCFFKLLIEDCISSSKDPFEEEDFYTAIFAFQKKHNLTREGERVHFDPMSVQKLFNVTNRETNRDLFKFKKVVKSAVYDIKGNGNFIQLSNDVLTTDLDHLVKNVYCGSLGSLWKSKNGRRDSTYTWKRNEFSTYDYHNGNLEEELKKQTELCEQRKKLKEEYLKHKEGADIVFVEEREWDSSEPTPDAPDISEIVSTNESISSMMCNYDASKFRMKDKTNRSYRNEFFRRNSFPFMKDETFPKYNKLAVGYEPAVTEFELHRSASFSTIQNSYENWELPFDTPIVKIARELARTARLNNPAGPNMDMFSENAIEDDEEDMDVELTKECRDFGKKFKGLIVDHKIYCAKMNDLEDVKWQVHHDHSLLENDMKEIDSLSSKLAYNVQVLSRRLREVERNLGRFENQLKEVQGQFIDFDCGVDVSLLNQLDDEQLKQIASKLVKKEKTKYKAICFRLVSADMLCQLKDNLVDWTTWLFGELCMHNEIKSKKCI